MHRLFAILFLLPLLSLPAPAQERTSEWNYIDERWPTHIGALIEEKDPDAYIHQVVGRESARLRGWVGSQGAPALDTTSACGVTFDGYLRQRPRGTYLIIVISSEDKADHKLKWIPVEYRFDEGRLEYFLRREGSPNEEPRRRKVKMDEQQDDRPVERADSDIRKRPEFKLSHKYLFDEGKNLEELRTRGEPKIVAKYKYLEIVKFGDPKELSQHEFLRVYLPWVDDCPDKPAFQFQREKKEEVAWDYPMQDWVSLGFQTSTLIHRAGWGSLDPGPGAYARFSDYFPHHGFSAELVGASLKSANANNTSAFGTFGRLSYGYSFWLAKGLYVIPEAGFRSVFGPNGGAGAGAGGGFDVAWEFPGTRDNASGQRLMFEAGCDFQDYFNGYIHNNSLQGGLGMCKIGFGLGW